MNVVPRLRFVLPGVVYVLATASPGPGIAAVLARVLSRGAEGVAVFITGFVMGDLIWFTLAATGMAALALACCLLLSDEPRMALLKFIPLLRQLRS